MSTTKTLKDRGQGSQIHGFLFFYLHLHVSLINPKNTVFSTQIHLVSLLGCPWKLVSRKTLVLFRQNGTTLPKFCGKDLKHILQATTGRSGG